MFYKFTKFTNWLFRMGMIAGVGLLVIKGIDVLCTLAQRWWPAVVAGGIMCVMWVWFKYEDEKHSAPYMPPPLP